MRKACSQGREGQKEEQTSLGGRAQCPGIPGWEAPQEGLWPGAVVLPIAVPMWTPAGLLLCRGDAEPNRVQLPKGIIQVYVTSCCGESSFPEIICGICLSTHYNVAEMYISSARTLQLLYNQLSSYCL